MRRLAFALILLAACSSGGGSGSASSGGATAHQVVYKLSGTASQADITYATANGGTSQQSEVDVPLKTKGGGTGITFTARPGAHLYISAQNPNDDNGTLTCTIEEDGRTVSTNTSRGSFTIVTCSASA